MAVHLLVTKAGLAVAETGLAHADAHVDADADADTYPHGDGHAHAHGVYLGSRSTASTASTAGGNMQATSGG